MTIGTIKLVASIITFLLALIFGLLPIGLARTQKHLLSIGDAFAGGVFLSAALLHMLPNASTQFQDAMPNIHYPLAMLLVAITFVLLFLLEHGSLLLSKTHFPNSSNTTPYFLALLIMVHSLIEGTAIGVSNDLASTIIIFSAVLAHKSSEGFALSVNLHRYNIPIRRNVLIIVLFSLMTPLGIFITTEINSVLQNHFGQIAAAILNALAAGTFLYLGTVHIIAEPDHIICRCGLLSLLSGISLMALVAIWV